MKLFISILTITSLFLCSCSKEETENIVTAQTTITFDAKVAAEDFALNKDFTIEGAVYNFTQLRYWISNVSLTNDKGETHKVAGSYYLLEENNAIGVQDGNFQYPARKREDITISNIPAGTYKSITFSIGIDSVYNSNLSLQSGELSQLNGMTNISWMWHTSYIFSSLKGFRTINGTTTAITVETGLNTNYRTLTIDFPATNDHITLNVDVAKIIANVDLSATPVIGASQPAVMKQVADNFSTKVISLETAAAK